MKKEENLKKILEHFKLYSTVVPLDKCGSERGKKICMKHLCNFYPNGESESEAAQSCPTLSDPMDCSLPGSSVHGIFQARVLEWGALHSPPAIARHC